MSHKPEIVVRCARRVTGVVWLVRIASETLGHCLLEVPEATFGQKSRTIAHNLAGILRKKPSTDTISFIQTHLAEHLSS